MDGNYSDLLIYNKVQCLLRRNVFNRFSSRFHEINTFLNIKGIYHPELKENEWVEKFVFVSDVAMHLKALNLKLQGKENIAFPLLKEEPSRIMLMEMMLLLPPVTSKNDQSKEGRPCFGSTYSCGKVIPSVNL